MITQHNTPAVRRAARLLALVPAAVVLVSAAPALADRPETWADPDPVSRLWVLVLLVGGPLALFAIITLLVYLPSMTRGEKYTPGLAWRNENEWFGGPRGGVEAADKVDPKAVEGAEQSERGGASARW